MYERTCQQRKYRILLKSRYRSCWKNLCIDPLKVTQQPQEPIAKKYRADFELVRDRVIAELEGAAPEDDYITEDDIFRRPKADTTKSK